MILTTNERVGMGIATPANPDNSPPWYANLPLASDLMFEANDPTSNWNVLLQSIGIEKPSTMRPSSQTQFQPPPSPQTAPAMTTWSPDQASEATAQQAVQSGLDTAYLQSVVSDLTSTAGAPPDNTAPGVPTWLWLVLLVVAALLLFGGRRR